MQMERATSAPQMGERLLRTKLFVPEPGHSHVPRARLDGLLDQALNRKLTTIVAPPGYGKTTLVSAWIRNAGARYGWISLEAKENEPLRFWRYMRAAVMSAMREVDLQSAETVFGINETAESIALQLAHVLADAALEKKPILIVLDDFQLVTATEVHTGLMDWMAIIPTRAHVILIGRNEMPLPLASLRIRGLLNELSLSDLRFTEEETMEYWSKHTGASPDGATLRELARRTEGWAAMLQLSALTHVSSKGLPLKPITGKHRHVSDYLMEEVYRDLPVELRFFMLRTSVLSRFSPSLCRALTLDEAAGDMIAELGRRGLFVIPLDDEREWYRYHHLFADFLQHKLMETDCGRISGLHVRAAGWHKDNGNPEEAIEHALLANEESMASKWIQQDAHIWLKDRETAMLARWIKQLSRQEAGKAGILILLLWIDLLEGRTEQAERLLQELDSALDELLKSGERSEYARFYEETRIAENYYAVLIGDFDRGYALITQYGEREDLPDRATPLLIGQGLELNEGVVPFVRGLFGFGGAIGQAERYHTAYGWFIEKNGLHESSYTAYQQIALAEVHYFRNELMSAWSYAEEGLRLSRKFGTIGSYVPGVCVMVKLLLAEDREAEAMELLLSAESELRQSHAAASQWRRGLKGSIALLALDGGDRERAREWLLEDGVLHSERRANEPSAFPNEVDFIRIRLLMGTGEWKLAEKLIRDCRAMAQKRRNPLSELQSLMLWTEIKLQQGDRAEGRGLLEDAIRLGCELGCVRPFLEAGTVITNQLSGMKFSRSDGYAWPGDEWRFVQLLLQSDDDPDDAGRASRVRARKELDELTAREREVLLLMAQGLSNKAIAAELVVTVGTVKLHLNRIYGKLGAQGRVHAVRVAENNGIIAKI
jgi:LuxR family maltose regulon positive regulatory protein